MIQVYPTKLEAVAELCEEYAPTGGAWYVTPSVRPDGTPILSEEALRYAEAAFKLEGDDLGDYFTSVGSKIVGQCVIENGETTGLCWLVLFPMK